MAHFKDTQRAFAAHIRDPENHPAPAGVEDRRVNIYRELFINSISGLLAGSFPVMRELYDEAGWRTLVRGFFRKEHNKTPYFPEIPREFMRWLDGTVLPQDKPFLAELAHYEWLELHLEKNTAEIAPNDALDADMLRSGRAVISELAELHEYRYPVHQISAAQQPQSPLAEPLFMLVYRNRHDRVHFSRLNPASAQLFSRLQANRGQSSEQVLQRMASDWGREDVDAVIDFGLQLMHDWWRKDVIVDSVTPSN